MDIQLTANDDHTFVAYQCGPEEAQSGVVVLPEIFGINGHIRQMADQFAAAGYRVVSPSLFDRAAPDEPGIQLGYAQDDLHRGMGLRRRIHDEDALRDIEAAAAALGTARCFVTGYCWGGYLTWRTACLSDRFAAASCWYGGGIVNHCQDEPRMPVQMHFGEKDPHISMKDVATIKAAQPGADIHTYPGAGHAFARAGNAAHHAESAALAWKRTLAFFARHGG